MECTFWFTIARNLSLHRVTHGQNTSPTETACFFFSFFTGILYYPETLKWPIQEMEWCSICFIPIPWILFICKWILSCAFFCHSLLLSYHTKVKEQSILLAVNHIDHYLILMQSWRTKRSWKLYVLLTRVDFLEFLVTTQGNGWDGKSDDHTFNCKE